MLVAARCPSTMSFDVGVNKDLNLYIRLVCINDTPSTASEVDHAQTPARAYQHATHFLWETLVCLRVMTVVRKTHKQSLQWRRGLTRCARGKHPKAPNQASSDNTHAAFDSCGNQSRAHLGGKLAPSSFDLEAWTGLTGIHYP